MKLTFVVKMSLLINIVLVVVILWQAQKTNNVASPNIVNEATSQVQTVCDIAVQERQKNDLQMVSGEPANVDFDTNPDAKLFRSTIASQVAEGANFAGHYAVATWGCGTECQGYAITDVLTGKIIEYVPHHPFQASEGLSFSANSNILVFNPKPEVAGSKTAVEVLEDDFEARKGRVYYLLTEKDNGEAYLSTLCIENLYSGLVP